MLVGYMRVSTDSDRQVLDLQRDALVAAGVDERHLFEDRVSGSRGDRTGLAKALAFIKAGDYQQHRASGLNLVVTAIVLWNTRYLERAVATLRQSTDVPDHLLAHLSPLGWEHVNLTGDYVWGGQQSMSENTDGLRPLRTSQEALAKAA